MKQLIDSAHKVIYKIYKFRHPVLAELIVNWKQVVGVELSSKTTPMKVVTNTRQGKKTNILYISADNSSISLEVAYKQELIIERIAVYLGYKAIHKIKLLIR